MIPPPRQHGVRYHGVFAPNATLRSLVVPRAPADATATAATATRVPLPSASATPCSDSAAGHDPSIAVATELPAVAAELPATILTRRLDWACLLARVFHTDVTRCPRCSGRLRILSFITAADVVSRILEHLGLPADAPAVAPARAPPQTSFDTAFHDDANGSL